MKVLRVIVMCMVAGSLLTGCSSLKKLTGQRNDTVLPGEREDILPADQQVNAKPGKQTTLADAPPCDPSVDDNCPAAVNQEKGGSDIQ